MPDSTVDVRPADASDAAAIAAIYRPYVVDAVTSFEETAPDAAGIAHRMETSPRLPWLVASRAHGVVGYAYASRHRDRAAYRWAVDCSVYLAPDERGRGTGRTLYATLLPILTGLGYVRGYAGIALPNPASVRLHEAMGFTAVGVYHQVGFKFGGWHDVGWWEVALRTDPGVPDEPREWRP